MKNEAAQQLGKLGGAARKAQKPDYSAMGKRGMARRWGKKTNEETTDTRDPHLKDRGLPRGE